MSTNQETPRPAHVPASLVYNIGLAEGPEFLAAPHEFMASLHDTHPPVFFSQSNMSPDGWMLTGYEDCLHVLRNPDVFTTKGTSAFPRNPDNYFYLIPLEIDPPEHRQYRRIVDPLVTPKAVAAMEDSLRAQANALIDAFIDKGECHFDRDFARPLPVSVFLELMGLPQDMRDTFVNWAMGLLHSQDRETAGRSMMETVAYLQKVIEEKRLQPDEGMVSAIVHGEKDGQPLEGRDVFGFVFFLFIAGLDTVFATLNNAFVWLANNPDRCKELLERPERMTWVVEELLRVFPLPSPAEP